MAPTPAVFPLRGISVAATQAFIKFPITHFKLCIWKWESLNKNCSKLKTMLLVFTLQTKTVALS